MVNRLIDTAVMLIALFVLLWVISLVLPLVPLPEPFGRILLVIIGAVVVVRLLYALRT